MRFFCPVCKLEYNVDDELVGEKGQCTCGVKFIIPKESGMNAEIVFSPSSNSVPSSSSVSQSEKKEFNVNQIENSNTLNSNPQPIYPQQSPMYQQPPVQPIYPQQPPVQPVYPQQPPMYQQPPVQPVYPQQPPMYQQPPIQPGYPQQPPMYQQPPIQPGYPQQSPMYQQAPIQSPKGNAFGKSVKSPMTKASQGKIGAGKKFSRTVNPNKVETKVAKVPMYVLVGIPLAIGLLGVGVAYKMNLLGSEDSIDNNSETIESSDNAINIDSAITNDDKQESVAASTRPENVAKVKNYVKKEFPLIFSIDQKSDGILQELRQKLVSMDNNRTIDELMKDPSYRQSINAYEIIRNTGVESFDQFISDYSDAKDFLKVFFTSSDWMECYLCMGRIPKNTKIGLRVLYEIWKLDGKSSDFSSYYRLSSAVAGVWSTGENQGRLQSREVLTKYGCHPTARYSYFKKAHKAGKLHPMFDNLKSWELIYVLGHRNDDESYEWLLENINIPLQRYTDACWAVTYQGCSFMGDTIQGPLFYRPWTGIMSDAENTKIHGGVCGSLSHFAAQAAAAHGIPSYAVGQPGHCAYAVRFARGDWQGGFGGPDGWTGMSIWSGSINLVNLAEEVFGDDQGLLKATLMMARSKLFQDGGDKNYAQQFMKEAIALSPKHFDFRKDEIEVMKSDLSITSEQWIAYAQNLLNVYGDDSRTALDLISRFEPLFLDKINEEALLAWFEQVHKAISKNPYSWSWNITKDIISKQYSKIKSKNGKERFLQSSLSALISTSYLGTTLEWGISTYLNGGMGDVFGRVFDKVLANSGILDDKALKESYGKIIVATEKAKSIPAFQTISQGAIKKFPYKPDNAKINKLPEGKLLSAEGILWASTYAWDDPLSHINILNPIGGRLHTDKENNPFVVVQLPKNNEIKNILLCKNQGNEWRLKHVKVSRSTDGATWFTVAETEDMPKQWLIDCENGTQAKWIKVEAINKSPEHFHIRNILIYGKE